MRIFWARGLVMLMGTTLLVATMVAPASAAKRVGAPWVVAASPTSITLDWSGHGSFRIHSYREGGGSKRSVKASTSERKVSGLQPGKMYCFQVSRANGSGRSPAFCHMTPTRSRASMAASITVATFNICGTACGRWSARRAAVLRRILDSSADVIALQEVSGRLPELVSTLELHGFDIVSNGTNEHEAVFARRGVLRREAFVGPGCRRFVLDQPEDTFPDWDKSRSHPLGPGNNFTWDEPRQLWVGISVQCPNGRKSGIQDLFGTVVLPNNKTAAWASLMDVATGRIVTVVSTHLSPGRSSAAAGRRERQTRALLSEMRDVTTGPVVITGDFNSSRARGRDVPRRKLERAGYVDAYDQATSYSRSYVSSSNGFAATPRRSTRFGDHIDRIFVPRGFGVSDWAVVAPLRRGRNVRPIASDHHPVRVTLSLP